MRWPTEQVPHERDPGARDGGRDVAGCVAQADGEDVDVGRARQQGGREGQDALAVRRGHLGEYGDDASRVLLEEGADGGQALAREARGRRREREADGAEQRHALDLARARVRGHEDGVEDGGEVDGVDGARELRGDDGALAGQAGGGLLREGAALHAVELQVNPPDARDGEHRP